MALPFGMVNTISVILSVLAILGCRLDRVHSHSFILGSDGTLEAVGYDVNARFNDVIIKNNIFFKSQVEAGLKFHSPTTKIIIPDGGANSFSIGRSSRDHLLTVGTVEGHKIVNINASLSISGDLDLSYSPTKLYIPNNEPKSLIVRSFHGGNDSSSSILSVDTSVSIPAVTLHTSFSVTNGFQSVAETYTATEQGFLIPARSNVVVIESEDSSHSVVMPYASVFVGHSVRFHNKKSNSFTIRVLDSGYQYSLNSYGNKVLNVTASIAIVDCFLVSLPGQWVCSRTNHAGRQDPLDFLSISKALIFKFRHNDTYEHRLEMKSSPSMNRKIYLPDASGTIITTGNLNDINGNVSTLMVKNEIVVTGNTVLGDSVEDNITLKGVIQNFNVQIVKGISVQSNVVKIAVMDHGLHKEQKVLIYSVDSSISDDKNVINSVYLIDNVYENTFCLKSQDGIHFLNKENFRGGVSVDFNGGAILPLFRTKYRTTSVKYINASTILINVTTTNFEAENSANFKCVQFNSQLVHVAQKVFRVIHTRVLDGNSVASKTISLMLQQFSKTTSQLDYFPSAFVNVPLYNNSCDATRKIAVGVENSSNAIVSTETQHGLKNLETIQITNVEGMDLAGLIFKAQVLTPYTFYLRNVTGNNIIDLSRSNVPGQGGTVTRMTVLEFQGGLSNNATTSVSILGPTKNRTIHIPDADGTILTTGNLEDIKISAGAITSMNISGSLVVNGNTSFGKSGDDVSEFRNSIKVKRSAQLGSSLQDKIKVLGTITAFGDYVASFTPLLDRILLVLNSVHPFYENDLLYVGRLKGMSNFAHCFYAVVDSSASTVMAIKPQHVRLATKEYNTSGMISRISKSRVLYSNTQRLVQYGTYSFVEVISKEIASFQVGDLLLSYNNANINVLKNTAFGFVVCNKTAVSLRLCSKFADHSNVNSLNSSSWIRLSELVHSNISKIQLNMLCSHGNGTFAKSDLLVFSNLHETTNGTFQVTSIVGDGCLLLNRNVSGSEFGAWMFVAKVGDDANTYVMETIQSKTSVLTLSTNIILNNNEVFVTYGDYDNPGMNGIIHTVESCRNCSSKSVNTSFRADSSFTASSSGNSSGFFVRITFSLPPEGTVLSFAQNANSKFSTFLTLPEVSTSDIKVSLPAVSGTIITTGNLHDIVVNRISADFPEDVTAAGDVRLGSDTSNEIVFGGTIQKPNGKNYYLAFGGSNRTSDKVTTLEIEDSTERTSILIPATSGIAITTGNFEDITKVGTLRNLSVAGFFRIDGSSKLGDNDDDKTTIHGTLEVVSNKQDGKLLSITNSYLKDANLVEFSAENMVNSTILQITAPEGSNNDSTLLGISGRDMEVGTLVSITADRLERGSLLEIQHASNSHFKGNLIDISSDATSLGDGHVVQIAANNMENGNVFSIEVPSLKSGAGMEITTLDGNELSQSGTLLKVSGNSQRSGILTSLQGRDLESGTILDISNNKNLTTGKLLHVSTSSPSSTNPVLIEGHNIKAGNLVVLRANELTHGSLLTVTAVNGSDSKSDSKLISVEAGRSQSMGVLVDVNAKNMQNGTALHVHSEDDQFSGTLMKISSSATTLDRGMVSISAEKAISGKVMEITADNMINGTLLSVTSQSSSFSRNASLVSFTSANTGQGNLVEIRGNKVRSGSLLSVRGPKLKNGIGIHVQGGEENGTVGTLLKLETKSAYSSHGSLISISAPNYRNGSLMRIDAPNLEDGSLMDLTGGSNMRGGALLKLEVQGKKSVSAIDIRAPNMVDGTAIKVDSGGTLLEATTNIVSSVNKAAVHISAPNLERGTLVSIIADKLGENGSALMLKSESISAGSLLNIKGRGTLLNITNKNLRQSVGMNVDLQAGIGLQINSNSEEAKAIDINLDNMRNGVGLRVASQSNSFNGSLLKLEISDIGSGTERGKNYLSAKGIEIIHNAVYNSYDPRAVALSIDSNVENTVFLKGTNEKAGPQMAFFNANGASNILGAINFNASSQSPTNGNISEIYGQIKAFKSGDNGGLAFRGMQNKTLTTLLNFKGDGTLEFGNENGSFSLIRPTKNTYGDGEDFVIAGQSVTQAGRNGGALIFEAGYSHSGRHGEIIFRNGESNEMVSLADHTFVTNIPKLDFSSNNVTWSIKSGVRDALRFVDKNKSDIFSVSSLNDPMHRGLNLNSSLNVSANVRVEDTLFLHGTLDMSESMTSNIIIPKNESEALVVTTDAGERVLEINTEVKESKMTMHGSLVVEDYLSFRDRVVLIRSDTIGFTLVDNNYNNDGSNYYTYHVSQHMSGSKFLLDFNDLEESDKICFFLPLKDAVGSQFTFKLLNWKHGTEGSNGYIDFALSNNEKMEHVFFGTIALHIAHHIRYEYGDSRNYNSRFCSSSGNERIRPYYSLYDVQPGGEITFTIISHNGRYPSYLFEGSIFMSGKQNVLSQIERSAIPECPMITLNTTFLNNLDILSAATNVTLSTVSSGFEFIHGRLRGMFMIIPYGVKNIRVRATTDTTENVVASFNSFGAQIKLVPNQISPVVPSAGNLLQFGTSILTVQIESQPGFEVKIVRSSIKSFIITPTITPFQFDSGRRENQYTTVLFATTAVSMILNFSNSSNLTLIKSASYLAREKGVPVNSFTSSAVVPDRNLTLDSGREEKLYIDVGKNYLYVVSPYGGIYEVLVVREGIKSVLIEETQSNNPSDFTFNHSMFSGQSAVVSRYANAVTIKAIFQYGYDGLNLILGRTNVSVGVSQDSNNDATPYALTNNMRSTNFFLHFGINHLILNASHISKRYNITIIRTLIDDVQLLTVEDARVLTQFQFQYTNLSGQYVFFPYEHSHVLVNVSFNDSMGNVSIHRDSISINAFVDLNALTKLGLNVGRNTMHLVSTVAGASYAIHITRGGVEDLDFFDGNNMDARTSFIFNHTLFVGGMVHVVKRSIQFIYIRAKFYGETSVRARMNGEVEGLSHDVKSGRFPIVVGKNYLNISTTNGGGDYNITIYRTIINEIFIRNNLNAALNPACQVQYETLDNNTCVVNDDVDLIRVTVSFNNTYHRVFSSLNGQPGHDLEMYNNATRNFSLSHGTNTLRIFNNGTGVMYAISIIRRGLVPNNLPSVHSATKANVIIKVKPATSASWTCKLFNTSNQIPSASQIYADGGWIKLSANEEHMFDLAPSNNLKEGTKYVVYCVANVSNLYYVSKGLDVATTGFKGGALPVVSNLTSGSFDVISNPMYKVNVKCVLYNCSATEPSSASAIFLANNTTPGVVLAPSPSMPNVNGDYHSTYFGPNLTEGAHYFVFCATNDTTGKIMSKRIDVKTLGFWRSTPPIVTNRLRNEVTITVLPGNPVHVVCAAYLNSTPENGTAVYNAVADTFGSIRVSTTSVTSTFIAPPAGTNCYQPVYQNITIAGLLEGRNYNVYCATNDTTVHIMSNKVDASTTGFVFANPNSDRRPTLVFRNVTIFDNNDAYVMVSITPMDNVDVVCAAFDEAPQNYSVIKAKETASNSGTNGAGVAYNALMKLEQAQYYDIYCATNNQVSVVSEKLTVATQFKIKSANSRNDNKVIYVNFHLSTVSNLFCSLYSSDQFVPTLGEHIVNNNADNILNHSGFYLHGNIDTNNNEIQFYKDPQTAFSSGNYTIYCAKNFSTANKPAILSGRYTYIH